MGDFFQAVQFYHRMIQTADVLVKAKDQIEDSSGSGESFESTPEAISQEDEGDGGSGESNPTNELGEEKLLYEE